jgi:probable blue pigment (indigoidine) exporter
MEPRLSARDLALTAAAPLIWGSTYLVTTELLPPDRPLTLALLRALPAGLLLLAVTRQLPKGVWWGRLAVLGAANFSIFWACLFVGAQRLPGGVAATLGAIQPLLVIGLQRLLFGTPMRLRQIAIGFGGVAGVALLVLGPKAALDPIGIAATLLGAVSMACGTVLTRHWRPAVGSLTFTAWQLVAGGLLLVPAALLLEPPLPPLSVANLVGLAHMALIGSALTYFLWFRGLSRLDATIVAPLGFVSPLSAVVLGASVLGEWPTPVQGVGMALVLASVWANLRG